MSKINDFIKDQEKYINKIKNLFKENQNGAYIRTLGCQGNAADGERLAGIVREMGYAVQSEPEGASLIIINTCAVREHAEQRALSIIGTFKRLKELNRDMILCVCGCMVSRESRVNQIKHSYPYVDIVFGTSQIGLLPRLICERIERRRRIFGDGGKTAPEADNRIYEGVPLYREDGAGGLVAIMYGCDNFCSYCIVPYVRGRERSRPAEAVADEVRELIAGGRREITLLGQNVNSYTEPGGFPGLLRRINRLEGDFWIRFMTSHPKDVSPELISAFAESDKVAPHFHLPMQSGSDAVLERMNRRYDTARYMRIVGDLRRAAPGVSVTSDIIVGFPGESEEDFDETLAMVERVGFDSLFTFIFSPREGTPAASFGGMVSDEEKSRRFARLLDLQAGISAGKNASLIGHELRVLCEGDARKMSGGGKTGNDEPGAEKFFGRTGTNKPVTFTGAAPDDYGRFVRVRITDADAFGLRGEAVGSG